MVAVTLDNTKLYMQCIAIFLLAGKLLVGGLHGSGAGSEFTFRSAQVLFELAQFPGSVVGIDFPAALRTDWSGGDAAKFLQPCLEILQPGRGLGFLFFR